MLEIDIPRRETLRLEHLVLDYNGTLAFDGALLDGIGEALAKLAQNLRVHVLTADTFGKARDALHGIACELTVLHSERQDSAKLAYIEKLGVDRCVCIGNGRNDLLMLEKAALGIAVMQGEGAAVATLLAADVAAPDILTALGLLRHPLRLVATLRL